jgi:hypothetical protein
MEHLTEYIVERAMRGQEEDTFDTHDMCRILMNEYPKEFVKELYACLEGSEDPFVKLHNELEKLLGSSYLSHVVRALGTKRRSMNCRGKEEESQVWEKTV